MSTLKASDLTTATYGSNSITIGYNAINTLDNCIVISCSPEGQPNTLEFRQNGDILVHGKLIESDKEIVDGFRTFLENILKQK